MGHSFSLPFSEHQFDVFGPEKEREKLSLMTLKTRCWAVGLEGQGLLMGQHAMSSNTATSLLLSFDVAR